MTNLTYSSQCNSWRPGRIDTKTTACLRELYSLTVLKSERFLYQKRYSWEVKLSIWWSEKVEPQGGFSSCGSTLPGLPSKYFRPHLVNWRRFQPACCFTAGKSDARRNLLQPVTEFTSVQRMQTKLTPIFSNGCV